MRPKLWKSHILGSVPGYALLFKAKDEDVGEAVEGIFEKADMPMINNAKATTPRTNPIFHLDLFSLGWMNDWVDSPNILFIMILVLFPMMWTFD